jgi:hypothetical protein
MIHLHDLHVVDPPLTLDRLDAVLGAQIHDRDRISGYRGVTGRLGAGGSADAPGHEERHECRKLMPHGGPPHRTLTV